MDKTICPVCGTAISKDAVYCSKCGADVKPGSHAFFCIRCGQPLEEGAKYCAFCREPVPYPSSGISDDYTKLVERAMGGDKEAFQILYEKRFNDLYYTALSMLRNPQDAEDVAQSTFVQAWKSIQSLRSPYAFKGWITKILSNHCMDLIRKRKSAPLDNDELSTVFEPIEDNIEFLPADIMDKQETRRLVRKLVDDLPEAQRQTIVLHYFEMLSIAEIADIMDVSEGTVKSRLYYGRKVIKEGVEKHEAEGIKLYSASGLPLLALVLREGASQVALSPEVIAGLWESASASIGIGAATSNSAGLFGKIMAASVKAKLTGGLIAAVVVTGSVVGGVIASKPVEPETVPTTTMVETVDPTEATPYTSTAENTSGHQEEQEVTSTVSEGQLRKERYRSMIKSATELPGWAPDILPGDCWFFAFRLEDSVSEDGLRLPLLGWGQIMRNLPGYEDDLPPYWEDWMVGDILYLQQQGGLPVIPSDEEIEAFLNSVDFE